MQITINAYELNEARNCMALIKEYFRLSSEAKTKYGPKTVLLMQVGACYECYSETMDRADIDEFCRVCELRQPLADVRQGIGPAISAVTRAIDAR